MAANAADLCLSSQIASDIGVTDDATAQRCVTAASKAIARHCGRTFEKQSGIIEYPPGHGRPLLILERVPVAAITSIEEAGVVVSASTYECVGANAEAGIVQRNDGVWMRTAWYGGNITSSVEQYMGRSDGQGIKVTYDAGYLTPGQVALAGSGTVTLPEDLQEAAIIVATGLRRRIGLDPNVAAEALGDWSVTYRSALQFIVAPEVQMLLGPYVSVRAI